MKHILLKADIILFLCIIAAAVIGMILFLGGGDAKTALIRKDGNIVRRVNLDTDQTFSVDGVLFEVSGGAIRFKESNCPGQECVHAGFFKRPGSSMACLPNRISVTVLGQSEVDAVAE